MTKGPPWFKCFPEAYLEDTRKLTPAQRGIYMDCLCLIYQFDGPLPNDDQWIRHQLHVGIRLWRAVRAVLVKHGMLIETPNGLINKRAEKERHERTTKQRSRLGSVSLREREVGEKSAKSPRKLPENSETPSDNNEGGTPDEAVRATRASDDRSERVEREVPPSQSPKVTIITQEERGEFYQCPSGTDGAGSTRVPFSAGVLAEIRAIDVDPEKLYQRYLQKTRRKRIADPSAYLLRMARDEAAKRLGCKPDDLKGVASRNSGAAARAQCAAVGVKREVPQVMREVIEKMNAKVSNRAALSAALRGRAA